MANQQNIVSTFWDAAKDADKLDYNISEDLDTFAKAQRLIDNAYKIDENQAIRPSREARAIADNNYIVDTTPYRTENANSIYELGTFKNEQLLNDASETLSLREKRDLVIASYQDAGISPQMDEVYNDLKNDSSLSNRQRALAEEQFQITSRDAAKDLLRVGDINGAMQKLAPFLPAGFNITPPEMAGGEYIVDTGNKINQKLSYPALVTMLNDLSAKNNQGLADIRQTESLDQRAARAAMLQSAAARVRGQTAIDVQKLHSAGRGSVALPSVVKRPQGAVAATAVTQPSVAPSALLTAGANSFTSPAATSAPQAFAQGTFPPQFPGVAAPESDEERKRRILDAYYSSDLSLQDKNALVDLYIQEYPRQDFFSDLDVYKRNKQYSNMVKSEQNLRAKRLQAAEAERLARQNSRQQQIEALKRRLGI